MALLTPSSNLKFVDEPDENVVSNPPITHKSQLTNMPRGKPKSGRVWKTQKERFSSFRMTKAVKKSFETHKKERAERKSVKLYERELKERRGQEKEAKRKRTEENKERREANQRKAEIVQPIKNTAKLKRMKKKQLRQIEKR